MTLPRKTKCAFVILKVNAGGTDYFLLRQDKDWNDLNLVGGHQEPRDAGNFKRTARRELYEELSALRGKGKVELIALTSPISFGPKWSKSAKAETIYEVQFFLAKLDSDPSVLNKVLSSRSLNFLVRADRVQSSVEHDATSSFLKLLDTHLSNGLAGVPYSHDTDLSKVLDENILNKNFQKQLHLNLRSNVQNSG